MMLANFLENGYSTGGGGVGQLIPGMGGMNPTGVDPLNPTGTSGIAATPNVFGSTTLSSGSGLMTPNAPIGTSVGDGGLSGNVGLIPGTNISSSFPANTAGTVGGAGQSGIQNLNLGSLLGFNANDPNMISQLDNMFGKGVGTALVQFLGGGAGYNPAIGTALINQMAPQEERTRNQILESFGASGGRYSSPAAIGLADYESSYSLGQQGILANLANQATDRYSNLFGGLIDTAYLTQANKLSPWNIISGIIGLAGNAGVKIPIPGIPGQTGPQGQPGKTGPTGPTSPTSQTTTKPTQTGANTNINFDPNNPFPMTYTPSGQPDPTNPNFANWLDWQFSNQPNWTGPNLNDPYGLGSIPGQGVGVSGGATGYDWQDPTGGGGSTPTIPIDSSTQYSDSSYNDPSSFDFFGSGFDTFGG